MGQDICSLGHALSDMDSYTRTIWSYPKAKKQSDWLPSFSFRKDIGDSGWLFRPAWWCKKQWSNWSECPAFDDHPIEKTLKKIAVFIPLALVTLLAFSLKFTGILIASCMSYSPKTILLPPTETVCGSGHFTKKTWDLGADSLHSIELLSSGGTLSIEFGDKNSLTMEVEDNLVDFFSYKLRNHQLTMGRISPDQKIKLREVHYALTLVSPFESLRVSQDGKVSIPSLHTPRFQCRIHGNGQVEIQEGHVSTQTINILRSGVYEASNCKTEHTEVNIHDSGIAAVQAHSSLLVNLSGSGQCTYSGNPELTFNVSGSGKVIKSPGICI